MKLKGTFLRIDFALLVPALVLSFLSLTTLLSVSPDLFRSQLIFLFLSLFIFLFFSQVNYKILQFYAVPIYIVSVVLLFVILLLGIESRGAVRWIDIFGLRIQFSEILKPFLAVSFATYLSHRNSSFETMLKSFALLLPILFFIYKQPDLGNAIIYLLAAVVTFIIIGFPLKWFGVGAFMLGILMPVFWNFLHQYQRQRFISFLKPSDDPLGISYNAIQAVIAVGSGMFFGKGLHEGTQSSLRFLPERHTDFIFATLSEELGFVGAMLIFIAFGFLLFRMYIIFTNTTDQFTKIFTAFCFSFILIQFFVNVGMNMGVVPIVGITLPFVSYGGSSLLSNFIILGLLSSASFEALDKTALEIR